MYSCSHQPRAVTRRRDGSQSAAIALFFAFIFAVVVMPVFAADPPAVVGQADKPKTVASPPKPGDGKAKPFLGGSQEGTGIRKAAPVAPKAAVATAGEKGDGGAKPFLGGGIEGTGIRKAAPVGAKESASAKKDRP